MHGSRPKFYQHAIDNFCPVLEIECAIEVIYRCDRDGIDALKIWSEVEHSSSGARMQTRPSA